VAYGYQIRETVNCQPKRILEIGIGSMIVSRILKELGFSVTTLDHNRNLHPDIVASVTDMPLDDSSFELVLCCEVLEHIPYHKFERALDEIHRVSERWLVMTLPDMGRFYCVEAKVPLMSRVRRLSVECPFLFPQKHEFDGEHYWEIGKKDYSLDRIRKSVETAGFTIEKTYRMREIPWHRMFVAHKAS